MIELHGIHKYYQTGDQSLHVLKGVDMRVREGELVSIMGSSGSGKSTLLNILGILDSYDSGSYLLDGKQVGKLKETEAARLRNKMLGFVFQSFNLLPFKNATENVALPLYYQGVGRRERNRRAEEYLDLVGLSDRKNFMPNQLSGGQKQRVAIARALVGNPKVILADEPTGALDSTTTHEIMALIRDIHRRGNTIIVVTHEQDVANMTQRQILLRDGVVTSSHAASPAAELSDWARGRSRSALVIPTSVTRDAPPPTIRSIAPRTRSSSWSSRGRFDGRAESATTVVAMAPACDRPPRGTATPTRARRSSPAQADADSPPPRPGRTR